MLGLAVSRLRWYRRLQFFLTQSGDRHMDTIARVARFGLLGRTLLAGVPVAVAAALTTPALARIESFPAGFRTQMVQTNGTRLHVRVGGKGPAGVLLHGFWETGVM